MRNTGPPCTYEKAGSTSELLQSSPETSILHPPDSCKEAVGSEPVATAQQHKGNTPRPCLPLSFLRASGIFFPKKKNPSENHSKVIKIMRLGGWKCLLTAVWGCSTPRDYPAFEFVSLKACWDDHCWNRLLQDSINTLLNSVLCRSSWSLLNFSFCCLLIRLWGCHNSKSIKEPTSFWI